MRATPSPALTLSKCSTAWRMLGSRPSPSRPESKISVACVGAGALVRARSCVCGRADADHMHARADHTCDDNVHLIRQIGLSGRLPPGRSGAERMRVRACTRARWRVRVGKCHCPVQARTATVPRGACGPQAYIHRVLRHTHTPSIRSWRPRRSCTAARQARSNKARSAPHPRAAPRSAHRSAWPPR